MNFQPSFMISTIFSSLSTMSAVIATARPAQKREMWLKCKVSPIWISKTMILLEFAICVFCLSFPCVVVTGLKCDPASWVSSALPLLSVGYAWLPLLKDGRVIMNENQIPVAANLPAGYLSCQEGASKVECLLRLLDSEGFTSPKFMCCWNMKICSNCWFI